METNVQRKLLSQNSGQKEGWEEMVWRLSFYTTSRPKRN